MRTYITIVAALFASVVSADSKANAFSNPPGGYTFTVGQPTTLTWKADSGSTVTLRLQSGDISTADSGTIIASNIANDGSFTWDVPSNLPYEPDYTIEIINDQDTTNYNFSPRFTVSGAVVASTTSTSTSTKTSTTTSTHTTTSKATSSTLTTTTTASSTSASSSSVVSTTTESTSTSAFSTTSAASVPTTNAGVVNRVSGGLLAVVAGAAMML